MRLKMLFALSVGFMLNGCTDASFDSMTAYGSSATILCYSGGQEMFKDVSTGKVMLLEGGNGWHYRSTDGSYRRVLADCIVTVR